MTRYICIHGHFYQPPRENAWLEAVEIQDGAYPYHDWNERITAECYAPNASSRILDDAGLILDIVSNYAKMSFNMGPTLLSWLERNASDTYEKIRAADRESVSLRSGHGSAMAQAYNHLIMPLASARDKRTQVVWGIRDFMHRFGRRPEGMWLPETAVDLETLDIMAEMGIAFTVLAPSQTRRTRPRGSREWRDVSDGKVDPSRAYACRLPSGREIALFFYDGPISQAVAFEELLNSGEGFAHRLMSGFSEKRNSHQLVHIATDGESYGHHHRFGDMALAYALDYIEKNDLARITNYGEFLEMHPPEDEAEIFENTSWSCVHGVERWRAHCGCSTGAHPRWDQEWRRPLRESLDWLRDELSRRYEEAAPSFFRDPWEARDRYIDVILDREGNTNRFLFEQAKEHLDGDRRIVAIKLLEMQRQAMLMFTSCGWFFDDVSGIETVQVMEYAARAMQLSAEVLGASLVEEFLGRLESARSNIGWQGTGADIFRRSVVPGMVHLPKVAAHYAISSLFEDYPGETAIYSYRIQSEDYRKQETGRTQLVTGRCLVTSEITGEHTTLVYSMLHLGGQDFNCGVGVYDSEEAYAQMTGELVDAFESGAFADLVRLIDQHFGALRYTLQGLFKDEQRSILETLIKENLDAFEHSYRRMYEENRILMGFLLETAIPVPKAFRTAAEFTLNLDLKRLLRGEAEAEGIEDVLRELRKWNIPVDAVELEFSFRRTLEAEMGRLAREPSDIQVMGNLVRLMDIAHRLPFELNLRQVQDLYFAMAGTLYRDREFPDRETKAEWTETFRELGRRLKFNLKVLLSEGSD
jgi:alpha-amylase/alpha-mannosidase (GH57 family)